MGTIGEEAEKKRKRKEEEQTEDEKVNEGDRLTQYV